jgi:thiamine biosynthesis lipoprotein
MGRKTKSGFLRFWSGQTAVSLGILGVAFAAQLTSRPLPKHTSRQEFSLPRMGTRARIVLYASDSAAGEKAAHAAFERMEELEQMMSDYREESELNRLTREAVNRPQSVSPELFYVLEQAQRISRLSEGRFDITIGPVSRLWRQARREHRVPAAAALAQARALVDYRHLELDATARTVMLKRPGMQLDLGGIAKGYAADEAIKILRSHGIRAALVALGGDLYAMGSPPGASGWTIDIENPARGGAKPLCSVMLKDAAISTSGDTQQFTEADGERYSHIVQPGSGLGLRDAAGTSVIARDGITADALATTLSVMSAAGGLKMIDSLEGASAFMVRRRGDGFEYFRSRQFPRACGNER